MPGNHDLYVGDVIREGRFEASFGETLKTELPEYSVAGGVWPWVRWLGDAVAVVGVNSARPNPPPWRSSGEIASAQLEALGALLRDPRLQRRFVFVMTLLLEIFLTISEKGTRSRFGHLLKEMKIIMNIDLIPWR